MNDLQTVFVEYVNGTYNTYASRTDKYISSTLKVAYLEPQIASALCQITSEFNEAQDLMYKIYND